MSSANEFNDILKKQFETAMENLVTEVKAAKELYGDALVPGVIIPFTSAIVMTGEITSGVDEDMGGEASIGFDFFGASASYGKTQRTGFLFRVTGRWGFNAPMNIDNEKLDAAMLTKVLEGVKSGRYTTTDPE